MKEQTKKYIETNLNAPLVYFLTTQFNADVVTDYDELRRIKNDFSFYPNVDRNEFKKNLIDVISKEKITPELFEELTDWELETQKEVNEFLINEIWKPLYGGERIEGYAKSK